VSSKPYRAVILGATGAVGSALTRELLASPLCRGVVAITRRAADFESTEKLRVHVIDLRELEASTALHASGCDVAFCTLGVGQPWGMPLDALWRVDVEYAGAFARGAAAGGVRHISLLSSLWANPRAPIQYFRVKGAAEDAVVRAGVSRTSLFRPSLLATDDIRYGLQDRLAQTFFPVMAPVLPSSLRHIHVRDLGRAMRLNAERPGRTGTEILHYDEFQALLRAAGG
jgi:uncharacterized protein YbjT (DUF2867 family)